MSGSALFKRFLGLGWLKEGIDFGAYFEVTWNYITFCFISSLSLFILFILISKSYYVFLHGKTYVNLTKILMLLHYQCECEFRQYSMLTSIYYICTSTYSIYSTYLSKASFESQHIIGMAGKGNQTEGKDSPMDIDSDVCMCFMSVQSFLPAFDKFRFIIGLWVLFLN